MSSYCQLHSRLYCDKAVQTEGSMAAIPHETDSSRVFVLSSGIADLAINELLSRSGSAYRQSNSSGMSKSSLSGNDKTWLDYNQPSWKSRVVQRRAVSHQDSVSCKPKTVYSDSGRLRVVSLPEHISRESCLSIEHEDLEKLSTRNRGYPSDLPQTPSPPSSPDSVVIVGNETHVPSSFFQSHVDEDGWTSWANSPPRPIPALHGPSSLPYARCPSGAEGTVVEGDDLATKVWGLGSDEGHLPRSKSPQPSRAFSGSIPLVLDDYQRVTSSALARHRDAVIDLVKPSAFCYPEAYDSTGRRLVSLDGTSPSSRPPERPNFGAYTATSQDQSDIVTTTSIKDLPGQTSAVSDDGLVSRNQALPQMLTSTLSRQSNLNSAAPSFIPTYARNTDSKSPFIQQDGKIDDFEYLHVARDGAALRHQRAYDLTPSSSASPVWSPVFQSVPTIVLGDYNPQIYSPQTDLDSYSNKFNPQQMNNQEFVTVQQRLQTEQGIKSSIDSLYPRPYVSKNAVYMKDATSVSHQQPRSIPLARLTQRQLSSVMESSSYELSKGYGEMENTFRRTSFVPGQSKVTNGKERKTSAGGIKFD